MNTIIMNGKLEHVSDIRETSQGTTYREILVSSTQGYKDDHGRDIYETFEVTLWRALASEVTDSDVGRDIMLRGRLESFPYTRNGENWYNVQIRAERVSLVD